MRWATAGLFSWMVLGGASGCIKPIASSAKPTAVELQMIGAYEELDKELVHIASFRGQTLVKYSSVEDLRRRAIRERAVQRYNEDDILELKGEGCLAERLDGTLALHPCDGPNDDPAWTRRRLRLIEEENRARRVIVEWAAVQWARREGRTKADPEARQQMLSVLTRLLREAALPGHLIEVRPERFEPKPGATKPGA